MRKKIIILSIVAAVLGLGFNSYAQLANVKRTLENYWFAGDNQVRFGATPNANISYTGGNLVLDVTSGGGQVSIPDGINLGTSNLSVSESLLFEGSMVNSFQTTLQVANPTSDRTVTIPDESGTMALQSDCMSMVASSINPTEQGTSEDYINLIDSSISETESDQDKYIVPVNMVGRNMRALVDVAPGVGNDPWTITLRDDSANTVFDLCHR